MDGYDLRILVCKTFLEINKERKERFIYLDYFYKAEVEDFDALRNAQLKRHGNLIYSPKIPPKLFEAYLAFRNNNPALELFRFWQRALHKEITLHIGLDNESEDCVTYRLRGKHRTIIYCVSTEARLLGVYSPSLGRLEKQERINPSTYEFFEEIEDF